MSLDVSPALLEKAERGEVDEAEFVDCVRTSLPYAWEMISSLVAQLKVDGGAFADETLALTLVVDLVGRAGGQQSRRGDDCGQGPDDHGASVELSVRPEHAGQGSSTQGWMTVGRRSGEWPSVP